jgi:serine/threonine protein kinase
LDGLREHGVRSGTTTRALAGYRLDKLLGSGQFAEVWLAQDLNLPRVVAVKSFKLDATRKPDAGAFEALRQQAHLLSQVVHPNIVRVYDWLTVHDRHYVVMQYVSGGSLADRLKREGALELQRAVRYVAGVSDGLLEAHSRGIVHRDVNPYNILWDPANDEALLSNFGVAALLADVEALGGSLPYMAQEAFDGRVLPAVDVYGLAATLYHLLTGSVPFPARLISDLKQQIREGLSDPDPRCAGLPEPMSRIIRAALTADPGRRPGLEELVATLRGTLKTTDVLGQSDRQLPLIKPEAKFRALRLISAELSSTLDLSEVLDRIFNSLFEIFPQAERGFLLLKHPSCSALMPEIIRSRSGPVGELEISKTVVNQVMNRGQAVLSLDLGEEFPESASLSDNKIRSLMCVPLFDQDHKAIGIMQIETRDGRGRFEQDDLDLLAAVASQISVAVQNAQLHKALLKQQERLRPAGEFDLKRLMLDKPADVLPPESIRRHTDISFPARVRVGKTHNLRVQIIPAEETLPTGETREIPKQHPHDVAMLLDVPRPAQPGEPPPAICVTIYVAAENLEIEGPTSAEIIVPLVGKSPAANFRLRGEKVGPGRVMIDFVQAGRPVGSVDLSPAVVAVDGEEAPPLAVTEGELCLGTGAGLDTPNLVIKVFEHRHAGQAGRLHFVISSTDLRLKDLPVLDGDLGMQDLNSDVADWVENQLRTLGSLACEPGLTIEAVSAALARVGCNLFEQLLPKTLQDLCWTIRQRGIRTLLILSDEPHIPWELIKPYRADPITGELIAEDVFWGEAFALTRWLRGRPPVQRFSFNRIFAMAPGESASPAAATDTTRDMVSAATKPQSVMDFRPPPADADLKAAGDELAMLRSLEASGARVRFLPARRRELLEAFEQGGFDLLHLVSHGTFGGARAADTSAVLMEDGDFRVAELSPRIVGALRGASPLIFFNTCHSGRIGFSLTRLGSWGARFVELGCGGFVGTLWPVTDQAAVAFAQAFYELMSEGLPIGEVMLRARHRVRTRFPNDPTWLAYCCFADPWARIERLPRPCTPETTENQSAQ